MLVGLLPPFTSDSVGVFMGTLPLRCKPMCKQHTVDCRPGMAQLIMHPYCIPVITLVPGWALVALEAPAGSVLRLVWSAWPNEVRRTMAYGPWATGNCQYSNGMVQLRVNPDAPQLPCWHSWNRITHPDGVELVASFDDHCPTFRAVPVHGVTEDFLKGHLCP